MQTRSIVAIGLAALGLGTGWYAAAQFSGNLPTFDPGDVLKAADLNAIVTAVQNIDAKWQTSGNNVIRRNGNVGIGIPAPGDPGEKLHIAEGNVLMDSTGERAIRFFRRGFITTGPSGTSTQPTFQLGRVIPGGDGDPEIRILYSDDTTLERSVFEVDRKGIVASVKTAVGSHFEGFLAGQQEPLFRLNSFPKMQLEMGPGGTGVDKRTDVVIRREDTQTISFLTGNDESGTTVERMRISPSGVQVTNNQYFQIPTTAGAPPAASDCNASSHAGRLVARSDGPQNLYVCLGAAGWVGK